MLNNLDNVAMFRLSFVFELCCTCIKQAKLYFLLNQCLVLSCSNKYFKRILVAVLFEVFDPFYPISSFFKNQFYQSLTLKKERQVVSF